MKKNKSDEGGERRLLFLGQGDQKKVANGRGLAVQLREKRKQFKGRAGCAVEGQALGRLRWQGKKIIKGEGRPASVNREREACGRPCSLWFFPTGRGAP